MPFQSLLAADRIVLLVEPGDRDAVLDAAARLLADASPAEHARRIARQPAQARTPGQHRPSATASPSRTAARSAFDHARGAFLRLREPVDFGASDGEPVDLVFAMAVPEHFTQQHLQLLVANSPNASPTPAFRAALRAAPDAARAARGCCWTRRRARRSGGAA